VFMFIFWNRLQRNNFFLIQAKKVPIMKRKTAKRKKSVWVIKSYFLISCSLEINFLFDRKKFSLCEGYYFWFPSAKIRTIFEVFEQSRESYFTFLFFATLVSKPSAKVRTIFEVIGESFQSCFTFLFLETLYKYQQSEVEEPSQIKCEFCELWIGGGLPPEGMRPTLYNGKVLLSFVIIILLFSFFFFFQNNHIFCSAQTTPNSQFTKFTFLHFLRFHREKRCNNKVILLFWSIEIVNMTPQQEV
jgi:hypothetical protein